MSESARRRIIVPLDVGSEQEAIRLTRLLRGRVGLFKVGLQLFTACGPALVARLAGEGLHLFLDLKLHDIPNTVARAVTEASRLGVEMLDVHASGGVRMMSAAAEAASPARAGAPAPVVLGITVLTSLDAADLGAVGVAADPESHAVALAKLARRSGLGGVVASPHEIAAIKAACGADFLVVTPGIRPARAPASDQKRVMTPKEAIAAGADYLVIGRPILEAADPLAALESIVAEMEP